MLAMNDQIEKVKEGATITVRNGFAKVLKDTGRIKLIVDKWGKVEIAEAGVKVSNILLSNNISGVEYELVKPNNKWGIFRGRWLHGITATVSTSASVLHSEWL